MSCKNICKLCDRIVISDSVTFSAGGNLLIDVPSRSFANGEKYCIVIGQSIPTTATINAPVYITIGGVTTTLYPLNNPDGSQVVASAIRTRTRYATRVATNATTGSFNLLCRIDCSTRNNLPSIPA